MKELHAFDLDGTLRAGSLLADALRHGTEEGFLDSQQISSLDRPSYADLDYFVTQIKHRSHHDFRALMDRITDEAPTSLFAWAHQHFEENPNSVHVVLSHSPDFLVNAFARGISSIAHSRGSFYHHEDLIFSGHAVTLEKVSALHEVRRELQVGQIAVAASDHIVDLAMLETAGRAIVVDPDRELTQIALERNWEIVITEVEAE